MSQQIACPNCGQTYTIAPEQEAQYAGQSIQCTRCGKPFPVVFAQPPQATAPPPPMPATSHPGMPPQYPPGAQAMNYAGPNPYAMLPTNKLAVAALVVSCVGVLVPLLGIVGIILGIVALANIKRGETGGKGLAIAGISVGGASMVLSLCMISILLPSLNLAREMANKIKCASNMREIGHALALYSNDNRGAYPPNFEPLLLTTDITSEVFICPSSNDTKADFGTGTQTLIANFRAPGHDSFVYVPGLNNSASAEAIVVYEVPANHGDGSNFLFGDGHVDFFKKNRAQAMINEVKAGHNPPRDSVLINAR